MTSSLRQLFFFFQFQFLLLLIICIRFSKVSVNDICKWGQNWVRKDSKEVNYLNWSNVSLLFVASTILIPLFHSQKFLGSKTLGLFKYCPLSLLSFSLFGVQQLLWYDIGIWLKVSVIPLQKMKYKTRIFLKAQIFVFLFFSVFSVSKKHLRRKPWLIFIKIWASAFSCSSSSFIFFPPSQQTNEEKSLQSLVD